MTASHSIFRQTAIWLCLLTVAAAPQRGGEPTPSISATPHRGEWITLPTDPYRGKRDDVYFVDRDHGWYGTGKGDLFHSDDGGATWNKIAAKPGTFIRALGFLDTKTGFIGNIGTGYYPGVSDETPLYRTDDGGRTWVPVAMTGPPLKGVCAIDVLQTKRIYQGTLVPTTIITAAGRVGGPAALARSLDGGRSWTTMDMSPWTSMILDVHFIDGQTGFVAGSSTTDVATTNAQILMTRDGGRTWKEVYRSKRFGELIWKLSLPTKTTFFGTVMSYDEKNAAKVIVKSVDAGRTWKERALVNDPKAVELGIGFVDARRGWVGTTIGGFETTDGGSSFVKAPIAPAANKFRVVRSADGTTVFAIGTQVQKLDLVERATRR